jgi:G:T-mismatch repair DNA endonuclease (very short patch repair protein)
MGWKVIIIWECEIEKKLESVIEKLNFEIKDYSSM